MAALNDGRLSESQAKESTVDVNDMTVKDLKAALKERNLAINNPTHQDFTPLVLKRAPAGTKAGGGGAGRNLAIDKNKADVKERLQAAFEKEDSSVGEEAAEVETLTAAMIKEMTGNDLKAALAERYLDIDGKKAGLQERLQAALETEDSTVGEEATEDEALTAEMIKEMTVKDLKAVLAERDLDISGKKADLQERLMASLGSITGDSKAIVDSARSSSGSVGAPSVGKLPDSQYS